MTKQFFFYTCNVLSYSYYIGVSFSVFYGYTINSLYLTVCRWLQHQHHISWKSLYNFVFFVRKNIPIILQILTFICLLLLRNNNQWDYLDVYHDLIT